MKKLLTIILSAAMMFGLAACSSDSNSQASDDVNVSTTEAIETAVSNETEPAKTETENSIETGTIIRIKYDNYIVLDKKEENTYLVWRQNPLNVDEDSRLVKLRGDSDTNIRFNTVESNIYEGSSIDDYLENTYYLSLSDELKSAIIETTIQQQKAEKTWGDSQDRTDIGNEISRHVFLPSLSEIETAVEELTGSKATFEEGSIPSYFFKDSQGTKHLYWLRDAGSTGSCATEINYYYFSFSENGVYWTKGVSARPAFIIDLSLIDYQVIGNLDE